MYIDVLLNHIMYVSLKGAFKNFAVKFSLAKKRRHGAIVNMFVAITYFLYINVN